jgi:hypothetical protein
LKKIADSERSGSGTDNLQYISNRAAQITKDDTYDCFGKYVASMFCQIGLPTAIRLEENITSRLINAMCPPTSQYYL